MRAIWGLPIPAIVLWAALACQAAPAGAAPPLHVVPFPGTPDASPSSHIIFSSLRRSEIRTVAVLGSASGVHTGRLTALPDGAGTAFLPSHAFTPGERVRVTATLSSPAAGTASGDPGATALDFSFTVAVPATATVTSAPHARSAAAASGRSGALAETTSAPIQSFHSAPELHPPTVGAIGTLAGGKQDILLTAHTPYPTSVQSGPMILDGRGRLVWFRPVQGYATNLEVQRYHRRPVLTWFQQTGGSAQSSEDVIVDDSYRTVATLHGGEGYVPDMHELQLTRRGTALIDAYVPVKADLSSIGGPADGTAMDCVIQELDVRTGHVLWEWHALGHVALSASYWGTSDSSTPYDFFHLNSIQQLTNGNLLISARNTWAVYEVNKQSGAVIWTLGGKNSSFRVDPSARFEWQHDARLHRGGVLTVFDDASEGQIQEEHQSSAKVLALNTSAMTASLLRRYTHRPPLVSAVEGNTQLLHNHDVFVGWGDQPEFSEYSASGDQIFSGSLPRGSNSYRAYVFRWHGQPQTRPSVAFARQGSGTVRVYVSWNGATRAVSWRVRGGARRGALKTLGSARRSGFETTIVLHCDPRYVAVQAVNDRGKVIATSPVSRP
jgi:hypothetical protein